MDKCLHTQTHKKHTHKHTLNLMSHQGNTNPITMRPHFMASRMPSFKKTEIKFACGEIRTSILKQNENCGYCRKKKGWKFLKTLNIINLQPRNFIFKQIAKIRQITRCLHKICTQMFKVIFFIIDCSGTSQKPIS